ncbi:MAG: glycosyltransferase, partial [Bacteroidales bacterium]|nr:glycosyltransferase [Bacteroidales bacterium]
MGNPKISVLLPFYNCEETLEEAIESIIDQTFKDFELLLIDNGSTDNCSEIANVYASKDKRIVLLNESRTGTAYALNTGLEV